MMCWCARGVGIDLTDPREEMQSWKSHSATSRVAMPRAAMSAIMFSLLPLASGAPSQCEGVKCFKLTCPEEEKIYEATRCCHSCKVSA